MLSDLSRLNIYETVYVIILKIFGKKYFQLDYFCSSCNDKDIKVHELLTKSKINTTIMIEQTFCTWTCMGHKQRCHRYPYKFNINKKFLSYIKHFFTDRYNYIFSKIRRQLKNDNPKLFKDKRFLFIDLVWFNFSKSLINILISYISQHINLFTKLGINSLPFDVRYKIINKDKIKYIDTDNLILNYIYTMITKKNIKRENYKQYRSKSVLKNIKKIKSKNLIYQYSRLM